MVDARKEDVPLRARGQAKFVQHFPRHHRGDVDRATVRRQHRRATLSSTYRRPHELQRSRRHGGDRAAASGLQLIVFTCRLVGLKTFSGSVTTKRIQRAADSPPSSLSHLRPPTEADKNALARENWCGEVSVRTFLTVPRGCYHYKWGYFLVRKHDTQLVWV